MYNIINKLLITLALTFLAIMISTKFSYYWEIYLLFFLVVIILALYKNIRAAGGWNNYLIKKFGGTKLNDFTLEKIFRNTNFWFYFLLIIWLISAMLVGPFIIFSPLALSPIIIPFIIFMIFRKKIPRTPLIILSFLIIALFIFSSISCHLELSSL